MPKILGVICQEHSTLSCGKSGGRQTVFNTLRRWKQIVRPLSWVIAPSKQITLHLHFGAKTPCFFFNTMKSYEIHVWNPPWKWEFKTTLYDIIWYEYVFINVKPVTCQCPGYLHHGGLQWSKGPPTSTSYGSPILIPENPQGPKAPWSFSQTKSQDNVKYLTTLEKFIEPLYSGTPCPGDAMEHFWDDSPALLSDVPEFLCSFLDGDPPVTKRGNGKSSSYRWFFNSNLNL